ncbi:hypothetical protein ZWY2020_032128 [Hordeum vulgare]|nr:hypothetical protein ZWY2020_032128 [Hordeum vulgare]
MAALTSAAAAASSSSFLLAIRLRNSSPLLFGFGGGGGDDGAHPRTQAARTSGHFKLASWCLLFFCCFGPARDPSEPG